ncbi:HET-domain-containing protein [Xylariaceae sp. FL1272]|nr:HET-domain-containing protein [Xylariaceae sp. FL1272]
MALYKYDPLASGYIRLATLQPGEFEVDIIIGLEQHSFVRDGSLVFEALSYAWGQSNHPVCIRIYGNEGAKLLASQNLVAALRHLRHAERTRVIWVDALCIDQLNKIERGPQVAMMGEIYRLATRVVVWLGQEADGSSIALDLVSKIGAQVEVTAISPFLKSAPGCSDHSLGDVDAKLPVEEQDTRSIYHLICRPWFERLWVRQEILLANAQAIVMCGSHQVTWEYLRRGLCTVYLKPKLNSDLRSSLVTRLQHIYGLIFADLPILLSTLRRVTRGCYCRDPRDRIYGVLALMPEHERALVPRPDYTQPLADLYRTVTLNHFEYYGSIGLICECELQPNVGSGPSWVPDWSMPRSTRRFAEFPVYASSVFAGSYQIIREGVLTVIGVSKSTVTHIHTIPDILNASVAERYTAIQELMLKQRMHGTYRTGICMKDAFTRTLMCDSIAENFTSRTRNSPFLEQAKRTIETILSKSLYDEIDFMTGFSGETVLTWMSNRASGRTLMHGTEGYIGLGPPSAEMNDEICVLSGCKVPMVLRPQKDGTYIVVGECFVLGLTQGEAMLGPLPDQVRVVEGYNKNRRVPVYCDKRSGMISFEDPRLVRLPIELDHYRSCLNEYPWVQFSVDFDVLRKWIPGLKKFDLI